MTVEAQKQETTQAATEAAVSESAQQAQETTEKPKAPDGYVPKRALQDERAKRQKAAEEAAYWRGQAEAKARDAGATPAQAREQAAGFTDADYYNNPAATIAKVREQAKAEAKAEAVAEVEGRRHQRFLDRLKTATPKAIRKHGRDAYMEREAEFIDAANRDPSLWDQAKDASDPCEFAYQWAEDQRADSGTDTAAENARLKAELEEYRAGKRQPGTKPTIPTSNAGARGSGATATPVRQRKSADQLLDAALRR